MEEENSNNLSNENGNNKVISHEQIAIEFAKRPAYIPKFRDGKRIQLICNLIELRYSTKLKHTQYSIKFDPEISPINYDKADEVLKKIDPQLREHFFPFTLTKYTLYSTSEKNEDMVKFETSLSDEESYVVIIEKTKNVINLQEVNNTSNESMQTKHLLELQVKNILKHNNGLIRSKKGEYLDYDKKTPIPGVDRGYTLIGFLTAAEITCSGLYLRLNDSKKLISEKTGLQKLSDLKKIYTNGNYNRECKDYFKNKRVLTKYGELNTYQIEDVSFDKNLENTIVSLKSEGNVTNVSLLNFYETKYKIKGLIKNQPLFVAKAKKKQTDPVYLVPELCWILWLDEENDNADDRKKFGQKLTPNEKFQKIDRLKGFLHCKEKKIRRNAKSVTAEKTHEGLSPEEIRESYGLEFGPYKKLEGRELPLPKIMYKNNTPGAIERGKIKPGALLNSIHFGRDDWVVIATRSVINEANFAIDSMLKASQRMQLRIEKPEVISVNARNPGQYVDELRKIDLNHGKKLVLTLIDKREKNFYTLAKQYFYQDIGIPAQNIVMERNNRNKTSLSFFSNILNQMTVKAGGELYSILIDDNFKKHPTMIIGVDSSTVRDKKRLVMVSSYNFNLSKGFCQIQYPSLYDSEIIDAFKDMCKKALTRFINKNHTSPHYVLLYRLGGNERQNEKLSKTEVPAFKDIFEKVQVHYIAVNKKSDLKFFQIDPHSDKLLNPSSGMVVDDTVIHPCNYEFYLQPQFVNQGTATPVNFHVLYTNSQMPLEILERITFNQTYYYWNWPGPIRVPALLKFAEEANKFVGKNLKDEVKEKLADTPYFI